MTRPPASFTRNNYKDIDPYIHGHYLNAKNIRWNPANFLNAALAGIGDGKNGGGPIWAIFDQGAVEREKWDPNPPNVDYDHGFFFKADTIPELAKKIVMKYQRVPMPPQQSGRDGPGLQQLRRHRPRLRLRQAAAAACDRQATVLCRLGNAGAARHACGTAHQRPLPGRRSERRGDRGPLLRRRVGGRLQPARARALPAARRDGRPQRARGERAGVA